MPGRFEPSRRPAPRGARCACPAVRVRAGLALDAAIRADPGAPQVQAMVRRAGRATAGAGSGAAGRDAAPGFGDKALPLGATAERVAADEGKYGSAPAGETVTISRHDLTSSFRDALFRTVPERTAGAHRSRR